MYPYPPANFAGDRHHRGLDKATSNVCTAQVLLANMAGMLPGLHHLREFSMGCPWDRVCPGFFFYGAMGVSKIVGLSWSVPNGWFGATPISGNHKIASWCTMNQCCLFLCVGGFPQRMGKTLGLNYPTQAHFAQRLEPSWNYWVICFLFFNLGVSSKLAVWGEMIRIRRKLLCHIFRLSFRQTQIRLKSPQLAHLYGPILTRSNPNILTYCDSNVWPLFLEKTHHDNLNRWFFQ